MLRLGFDHTFLDGSLLTVDNVSFVGFSTQARFNGDVNTGVNTNFSFNNASAFIRGEGTLTLNGSSVWSGGSMIDTGRTVVASGTTLNIEGTSNKFLSRTLDNLGSITYQGSNFNFNFGGVNSVAILNNEGEFNSIGEGDFDSSSGDGNLNVFNNQGNFNRSGVGTTIFSSVAFNNSASVAVTQGTLDLQGGYVQTAGTTLLNGGTLTSNTALDIQGGQLAGFGTFTTNVDNAGLINPGVFAGDLKTLNITGNYEETDTANINIEIGSLTEFDRVFVDGAVSYL